MMLIKTLRLEIEKVVFSFSAAALKYNHRALFTNTKNNLSSHIKKCTASNYYYKENCSSDR